MPDDFLAAFQRVKHSSTGATAQCPAHEDARNSLSIRRGDDGRWLLKCHAGCELAAILAAARLTTADLFPANGHGRPRIVATYDYRDESGALLYQSCRFEPKAFRQRAADGAWSIEGIRRVLYRLPELRGHATVFIPEGEKDVDRLWSVHLPATTNAGGAGKWRAEYAALLKTAGCRRVVVIPDNDPPGATHGRTVARSCADAGLEVQLIALPDLPDKGDVSDYLDRHRTQDLCALIAAAPLYRRETRVAEAPTLTLTSVADFLDEPDEASEWIVEDRIPAGAVVLVVGAPKDGKSTLMRELAVDVVRGEPWLGWRTARGAVWLLAFEDKRSEVRRHLRRLGVAHADPLRLWVAQAPGDLLPRLEALAATEPPALIVIDTLARALQLKDLNDYAQVSAAFDPWLRLARTTGATLLFVHHASVHTSREGLNAILGSTALAGSVDNVLILRRVDGRRVLSSVQRIGADLEPMIVTLHAETGRLTCAGTKRLVDERELRDRLVAALEDAGEPVRESWLHGQVDGRKADLVKALRVLLSQQRVIRTGAGGRGDPYLYRLVTAAENTGSQISPSAAGSRRGREPESDAIGSMNPGLFSPAPILVPRSSVPCIQGTYAYLETETLVPAASEIAQSDRSKTAKTPSKPASDSGSQISALGAAAAPANTAHAQHLTRQTEDLGTSKNQHEHWSDAGSQISESDDDAEIF